MSVYVGIDVHRKRSQVAVAGEDGRVQLNRNVVNGSQPMLSLLGGLPPGTPVAFEAAFGWGWLAGLLEDYGFEAHLVHPLRCKAIASARLKNDKVDAAILAQLDPGHAAAATTATGKGAKKDKPSPGNHTKGHLARSTRPLTGKAPMGVLPAVPVSWASHTPSGRVTCQNLPELDCDASQEDQDPMALHESSKVDRGSHGHCLSPPPPTRVRTTGHSRVPAGQQSSVTPYFG